MAAENPSVIKGEYGSEDAGQRVGRVSVSLYDRDGGGQDVCVDFAIATIGERGARLGSEPVDDSGEIIGLPGAYTRHVAKTINDSGFVAISGLSARISTNGAARVWTPATLNILRDFASYEPGHKVHEEAWFDTDEDSLDLLRRGLQRYKAEGAYPALYYGINARILHKGTNGSDLVFGDGLSQGAKEDPAPLADIRMKDMTARQKAASESICQQLAYALYVDEKILTKFRDLGANDPRAVKDDFVQSRLEASAIESDIIEIAKRLVVMGAVHIPVGSRREEPYIDATSDIDDLHSYNRKVLESIVEEGRAGIVKYALEEELCELKLRLDYALEGTNMFSRLLDAEQKLADK